MKKVVIALLLSCAILCTHAQEVSSHRDFPLIVSLQFHAFALPGRDILKNFLNPGIGIGTEFSYNDKQNWVQQIQLVWFRNKAVGNGLLIYTQPVWRPDLGSNAFAEFKIGAGYLWAYRPVRSFQQTSNGSWKDVGYKGKGMLVIPAAIGGGFDATDTASPFINYQFLLVPGYNSSIPLVPETLIQIGSRFTIENK